MVAQKKIKKRFPLLYIPWFSKDEDFIDDEEDSWVAYIRRNLHHSGSHDTPFPDSSWSYARHDSPFDEDENDLKKSDATIKEEVLSALYKAPDVDASKIKVIVLSGIVDLIGTVSNLHQKKEAERVVRAVSSVWSVHNELEIEEEGSGFHLAYF